MMCFGLDVWSLILSTINLVLNIVKLPLAIVEWIKFKEERKKEEEKRKKTEDENNALFRNLLVTFSTEILNN